jgi:co-chaperonin GroES (HSP10)
MTATTRAEVLTVIQPVGYHLLVRLLPLSEKTKGGIYRPQDLQQAEQMATQLGEVIEVGAGAYADPEKFPDGPWCEPGDHIMMRSYSGTSFKIDEQEYRLINDDTVEAVVRQPSRISRV